MKSEGKMVYNSRKVSCLLAKISSFFENCFPLIPIMFPQQKTSSDQETLFPLDRKSVCTSRIKDFLKKKFPLYGKAACTLKNL